jgi:hypothetical protein
MSKKYIELKVKFSPLSTGRYHVVVRSSAALEYENSFDWPVRESQNSTSSPDNASANTQVPSHQISSKQTSDSTRHIGEKDSDGVSASRQANQTQAGILKLGSALFQSVFESGERFGNFLRDVQELLPTRDDFRLRFNLEQTPELAIIPWEYIRNPFTSSFLVQEMSLVRDLSPIRTIQGVKHAPLENLLRGKPLRVLVMISQANDLDTPAERKELEKSTSNIRWN